MGMLKQGSQAAQCAALVLTELRWAAGHPMQPLQFDLRPRSAFNHPCYRPNSLLTQGPAEHSMPRQ